MGARRLSFWLAVGGVSILSNFLLEVAAARFPGTGLSKFTRVAHNGVPTQ